MYLSMYYTYRQDDEKAIEHLALFSKEDNYIYWILLLNDDPLVDHLKTLPAYKKVMKAIETKFWNKNKEIKARLEKEGLPL